MAARALLFYLPIIPMICMLCMIIGVAVWVHFTKVILLQLEYAMEVLGPAVTAPNYGRGEEALKGTSSSYMLFACALFGLGLWRKLLSVEHDMSGSNAKLLNIYRIVNGVVHFLWWLIMVWIVVLMMGLAVLAILTWVSYHGVQQVLANQQAMAPLYSSWKSGYTNWTLAPGVMAAAGNDLILAVMISNGWPPAVVCPSTCANLRLFAFVQVNAANACVCDSAVLTLVAAATRTALDAVAGMFVGIWFMYVFGDFFKTSLACDFTSTSCDINADHAGPSGGLRNAPSLGRGYNKL